MLLVSELELWGDGALGLLGQVLAGHGASGLGDTLRRLVRTGQRTLDRVGATLGSLMRAHEGAGHRIARLLGDVLACHSERRRIHATFMSLNENHGRHFSIIKCVCES